jgi:hypothetical protein
MDVMCSSEMTVYAVTPCTNIRGTNVSLCRLEELESYALGRRLKEKKKTKHHRLENMTTPCKYSAGYPQDSSLQKTAVIMQYYRSFLLWDRSRDEHHYWTTELHFKPRY